MSIGLPKKKGTMLLFMGSGSAVSIQLLLVGLGARATAILMRFGFIGSWWLFRCRGRLPVCAYGA